MQIFLFSALLASSGGRWRWRKKWHTANKFRFLLDIFLNINSNISNINISAKSKERAENISGGDERERCHPRKLNSRSCQRMILPSRNSALVCLMNTIVCDYFLHNLGSQRRVVSSLIRENRRRKENVFIRPKATRLFNNSFEKKNFQLL